MHACLTTAICQLCWSHADITTSDRSSKKQRGMDPAHLMHVCAYACMHAHGSPMCDKGPAWIWHGCRLGLHLTTLMLACRGACSKHSRGRPAGGPAMHEQLRMRATGLTGSQFASLFAGSLRTSKELQVVKHASLCRSAPGHIQIGMSTDYDYDCCCYLYYSKAEDRKSSSAHRPPFATPQIAECAYT